MEECLTHGNYLLNKICLEGGSPCSYPRAKSMQIFMEMDRRRYPEIDDARYRLPQYLHQANFPEVGEPPLGIITTVCQVHRTASTSPLKSACMMTKTFSHFSGSGCSSRFAARSHNRRCSDLIPDGTPVKFSQSQITALEISSFPGMFSFRGR